MDCYTIMLESYRNVKSNVNVMRIRFSYSCASGCVFSRYWLFLQTLTFIPDTDIDCYSNWPLFDFGHWFLLPVLTLCLNTGRPVCLDELELDDWQTKMNQCINCGIATDRCNTIGRRSLEDEAILSIVREWVAPQTVSIYLLFGLYVLHQPMSYFSSY